MNQYVTGAVIRQLRIKNQLTQGELAEKLNVSDKAISKWETAKGYPDIALLEPIAKAFGISITELISGNAVTNMNVSANMLRSQFYVCPVCGNVLHSTGEAVITCHGVQLLPEKAEQPDERHSISITRIEDEYYVQLAHQMTKTHYISFIAALSPNAVQLIKLYPESPAECRLKIRGVKKIYFYCNRDGLFSVNAKDLL
ncbi:MAG: helix-turn-helix domain-containing protein [Lachnospiraceae bacterium]|nr:helix-turn-helix domain-containing protein [Lachnospiraceae bacterium]